MKQETVSIAWCDNGMVDGKFMQGITDVVLRSGVKFESCMRSCGNQIARQREKVIRKWYADNKSDWLLWVDSDVVISPEKFLKLWKKKDSRKRPLISGLYFTSVNPEEPLMVPIPVIYNFVETDGVISMKHVDPVPKDDLIKVDAAGMGFILITPSVSTKL